MDKQEQLRADQQELMNDMLNNDQPQDELTTAKLLINQLLEIISDNMDPSGWLSVDERATIDIAERLVADDNES